MPDMIITISYVIAIILSIGGAVSTVSYFLARAHNSKNNANNDIAAEAMSNLKTTVEAVKTQNALQAGQITQGELDRRDLNEKVLLLAGKVETLSTIPLAKIEQHMADTNRILQAVLPLLPTSTIQHSVLETTTTSK